jgi:hypothetical protein
MEEHGASIPGVFVSPSLNDRLSCRSGSPARAVHKPESHKGTEDPDHARNKRKGLGGSVATTIVVEADVFECLASAGRVIHPLYQQSKRREPGEAEDDVHGPCMCHLSVTFGPYVGRW